MKHIFLLLFFSIYTFAGTTNKLPDLTMTWVGWSALVIFIIGYYFVATEEHYHIDKAKPALMIGIFMFILVAFYYYLNNLNMDLVHYEVNHLILEIAGIFFFLFVAMTYIESLIHMGVFDRLKYSLIVIGYFVSIGVWYVQYQIFGIGV